MRSVPSDMASKLAMKKQTRANKADPSASIWIGRPTTALTTDVFLERQTVLTGATFTDASVAVCHPRLGSENTRYYVAYIRNGTAKIITSPVKARMSNHIWTDVPFLNDAGGDISATAISIAYDGTMPKNERGIVEFVTEQLPWVFWVTAGKLYGRKMGAETDHILAESNCTDVSAIRAMWSEVGGFDFGLIVFFLLRNGMEWNGMEWNGMEWNGMEWNGMEWNGMEWNGTIYYRQLIDGEWTDAEVVSFGPAGVTWTEIAAFRTWDYRVGVQAKGSDGYIYELFTQFMGIGKQNVEHIDIRDITATGVLTPIKYHATKEDENIEISNIVATGTLLYGHSSVPVLAENLPDEEENWGIKVTVTLDYPVTDSGGNNAAFRLTDERDINWTSITITISGKDILIVFPDFNSAFGDLTLSYIPGTLQSPAIPMATWSIEFTPQGLIAPQVDPPEPTEVWNE